MLRIVLLGAALLVLVTTSSGCSICQAPDDCAYAAYGGLYPRADMYHGRVGSAFEPAGGEMVGWEQAIGPEELEPGEPEEATPRDPEGYLEDGEGQDVPEEDGLETAY